MLCRMCGVGRRVAASICDQPLETVNKTLNVQLLFMIQTQHSLTKTFGEDILRVAPKLMREKHFVPAINSVNDFIRVEDSTAARCVLIERHFSRNFNKNTNLARSAGDDKRFNQIIQIGNHAMPPPNARSQNICFPPLTILF